MVRVAESDTPPEGYYEKSGDFDLAPELGAIANKLRGINGISNKLVIVPSAIHEAYTNMEYISLSGDYMAMAMIDNYHGYPAERLAEDVGFVIQILLISTNIFWNLISPNEMLFFYFI